MTFDVAQYPLYYMTYAPAKFKAAMSKGLGGNAFARNIWFDLDLGNKKKNIIWSWPQGQRGQGHTKCCQVPSTSCDLCIAKVWYCYIPRLRRRCIYKKRHYLTLNLRMLPSALYIMWPMHLQIWNYYVKRFRRRCNYKKFNNWPWGQGHTKCCTVPSTSCELFSYQVWSCYI